jgi:hypothetical protein
VTFRTHGIIREYYSKNVVDRLSWLGAAEERIFPDVEANACCPLLGEKGVPFIDLAAGCQ